MPSDTCLFVSLCIALISNALVCLNFKQFLLEQNVSDREKSDGFRLETCVSIWRKALVQKRKCFV